MKIKKILLCLIIYSAYGLSAQTVTPKDAKTSAAPAPAAEAKWYDKVDFSGYVDVYYKYTSNNRQGATQDTSGTFDTYNKQFAVNAVKLAIEKLPEKASPWGFRMDLQNGQNLGYQERPYQTTNSIYNMQMLQQAYVSMYFPVAKGLVIDAGKMATHIGNELLDSKDNINYTIGYIFFNTIPFIHTGARATLTLSDKLSGGLYLYNSAQGTGYTANGQQFGFSGATPAGANQVFSTANHVYADGPNPFRAYGSQVKYDVIPEKFQIVWNTLFGNDVSQSRMSDSEFYLSQSGVNGLIPGGQQTLMNQRSRNRTDNWFVNHMMFIVNPTSKLMLLFDWTHGERQGYTINSAAGYANEGFFIDSNRDGIVSSSGNDLKFRPDGQNVKKIYNTYGLWAKYTINDTYALGLRYEHIDDHQYGGALAVNPPGTFVTPRYRGDLQAASGDITNTKFQGLGRPASSQGQARTFTITPIINWTENLLIKIDLRRDWAKGEQFVDTAGRAVHAQHGVVVGVVAKF